MSTRTLYRLSGVSLLLGGILGTIAHILHLPTPTDMSMLVHYTAKSQPVHIVLFVGIMLVLLGLPGLAARQSERAGILGLVGFVLMFFGITFADGLHCVLQFSAFPVMAREIPTLTFRVVDQIYTTSPYATLENAGGPIMFAGTVLFGVATLRAGVMPRWVTAWFVAFPVVMAAAFIPHVYKLVFFPFPIVLYLAFCASGTALALPRITQTDIRKEEKVRPQAA